MKLLLLLSFFFLFLESSEQYQFQKNRFACKDKNKIEKIEISLKNKDKNSFLSLYNDCFLVKKTKIYDILSVNEEWIEIYHFDNNIKYKYWLKNPTTENVKEGIINFDKKNSKKFNEIRNNVEIKEYRLNHRIKLLNYKNTQNQKLNKIEKDFLSIKEKEIEKEEEKLRKLRQEEKEIKSNLYNIYITRKLRQEELDKLK